MIKFSRNEFLRFVVSGGVNTLLTYVIYAGLVIFLGYSVAFTLSYGAGIVIAYVLNSRFVFGEPLKISKAVVYPVIYLVQYLFGLACLYVLIEMLKLDKYSAPILVVLLSFPLTFILNRLVIKGGVSRK